MICQPPRVTRKSTGERWFATQHAGVRCGRQPKSHRAMKKSASCTTPPSKCHSPRLTESSMNSPTGTRREHLRVERRAASRDWPGSSECAEPVIPTCLIRTTQSLTCLASSKPHRHHPNISFTQASNLLVPMSTLMRTASTRIAVESEWSMTGPMTGGEIWRSAATQSGTARGGACCSNGRAAVMNGKTCRLFQIPTGLCSSGMESDGVPTFPRCQRIISIMRLV